MTHASEMLETYPGTVAEAWKLAPEESVGARGAGGASGATGYRGLRRATIPGAGFFLTGAGEGRGRTGRARTRNL